MNRPSPPRPWSSRTYDMLADAYAAANPEMRPGLVPYAQRVLDRLRPDDLLLDVGCGTGRDLAWFARRHRRVLGLDASIGMLSHAGRDPALDLAVADVRHLPLPDGVARACWCVATLIHLPKAQMPTALGELRRVLAVGGTLLLGVQEGNGSVLEADPYTGRSLRLMTRYQSDELVGLVEAAGFASTPLPADPDTVGRWVVLLCAARP
ncbi:class I SAM-dependent methyltransferase [Micromonospora sp. NPDC023644]|uniref:class I SAM-dependent methyltransferase n=1 Tax=Micromonospora sp. NPDC023644 TaxID=3154321 RepID=UPI0034078096